MIGNYMYAVDWMLTECPKLAEIPDVRNTKTTLTQTILTSSA